MNPILEARDLRKTYGKVKAVDGISFSVREGTCFGLLGPNGAGKSTTIEILESILEPDSGEVYYKGERTGYAFKERIGIQFQDTSLQEFLTVRETLDLFRRLYPRFRPIEEIVKICGLEEFLDRDNRKLSGGQRQRMLLGVALINDPDLLFLDEPTTGLDPQARRNFWHLIEDLKSEGRTIILTTHYMDEAESLCDEVVVMNHGRIIEQGAPADLLVKHFGEAVVLLPDSAFASAPELSCSCEKSGGRTAIRCKSVSATLKELLDKGISLEGLTVERRNLDDLFLKLTGTSLD
jgi:ABC-2 type transport system ATP-binding protein